MMTKYGKGTKSKTMTGSQSGLFEPYKIVHKFTQVLLRLQQHMTSETMFHVDPHLPMFEQRA